MHRFLPLLICVLTCVLPFLAKAQSGGISGKVTDSTTHEALIGATVFIESDNSKGSITDDEGAFTISGLQPGSYTVICKYVSYKQKKISSVKVVAGQETNLSIPLGSDVHAINEVTVKEARITNTENAVLTEMRKSDVIVSGISANQIAKTQDRDAADVVKRVPGVTVIDNRFITVRGLNDRYNTVWLNDAGAPSFETDKKSFSFDVLPSGLIDRVLIYKTPSPELPGDFAGGMVKIYTKAFPTKSEFSINWQESFRSGSTFNTFYYTPGSKTDWLGYDNGFRNIPAGVPDFIVKNDADNGSVTKLFNNTWGILQKDAMPDMRLNLYYTKAFELNKVKLGTTLGAIYTNLFTTYNIHRADWDSLKQQTDYTDVQSTNFVRTALLANVSALFGNFTLEFKNFLNQNGIAQTTLRNSNFADAPNQISYAEDYQERTTFSSQMIGNYKAPSEKTVYNWSLGYDYSYRNEPDFRRIKYTKQQEQPDSLYLAQVPAGSADIVNGGGRFYSMLNENVVSFTHNLKQKLAIGDYHFELNAGNYLEYKYRWFFARELGYVLQRSATSFPLLYEPVGSIFQDANLGSPGFQMDEITNKSDKYTAENKLIATYVSVSLPIGKKIKVVTGARYEYNVQSLQSFVNQDSVSPNIKTSFLLPSINATYNFNEKSLIRLAYGKTLNRPEFREWAPFYFYDFDLSAGTYGSLFPTTINPNGTVLKVAQIENFDARYEWYPSNGEVLQIGAFYKTFKDPIQRIIIPTSGSDSKAFTFINGKTAYVLGAEIEARKNLGFIEPGRSAGFFSALNLVGNVSFMESQVTLNILDQELKSPLQGQSPYVVNVGFYYQNDSIGLQGSVLYNVAGPRVYLLGTADIPSIGEMPRNTVDITVTKKIGRYFSLTAGIQDLLNQSVTLIDDTNRNNKFQNNGTDKVIQSYKKGSYYTLGVKFQF